jgi:uncharacterized GH25 family protein/protocatechuate 3,4-dioxygenase beta subunit
MAHSSRVVVLLLCLLLTLPTLAAVSGSVMTPDGKPLAGARVSLYATESDAARRTRLQSAQPEAVPLASTQTDARGSFSLDSPKQPVARLMVTLRGYTPLATVVERDEAAVVVALNKADSRTGSVTADGKPVANATVALVYDDAEVVVRTNEKGEYEAADLKHATEIVVRHPDFAIDQQRLLGPGFPGGPSASALQRKLTKGSTLKGVVVAADGKTPVAKARVSLDGWQLAESAEDGSFTIEHAAPEWRSLSAWKDNLVGQRPFAKGSSFTLRLDKGATFSGRVLDARTKLPVTATTVQASSAGRRFAAGERFETETDAKGTYSVVVPPGTWQVIASHPAYDLDRFESSVAAGQGTPRDIVLPPLARITGVVVDEGNKPVAAAAITPERVADFGFPGRMFRAFRSATSGPDGKFTLRTEGDRDVRVRAFRKGFPPGRTDALKLAAGERKSGVIITVPTGIEVAGKVLDAQGNPLSGASIAASETQGRGGAGGPVMQRVVMMGGGGEEDESVQSASDGSFSMRVKEGVYDFTIKRDGFAPRVVRARSVSSAGNEPFEVRLDAASEISGRVTRAGAGVAEVAVLSFGGADARTTTAADGSFTLSGLAAGPATVMFMKPEDFINERRSLTAPERDVVIEIPAGGRVSGRVVEKGSRRPVTSFEAGITISRGGGGMMMMGPPQTRPFNSDDGSFVLENVPAGSMTLVANAPGFVTSRMNVTIEEGKSLNDLVLELDAGVKLTGRVTNPSGQPLSGVTVTLGTSPRGNFAMGGPDKRATTDANGEYSMDALNTGEETIVFSHPKYVRTSRQVTLKGAETRLDAQLEAGARVAGTVVDEAGVPASGAIVQASGGSSGWRTAETNASGAFEFESLGDGHYKFTARLQGYADGSVDDYDPSSGAPLRIVLKTGGTIYGHVTGLSEAELANAFVLARGAGTGAQTPIDSSGNYRLEGAPVGNVSVTASVRSMNGSRSTSPTTVTVAASSSQQVDLAFRSDVVIQGRVRRNGAPLSNGQVMFMMPGRAGGSSNAALDSDGNYRISGLEDGKYIVTVMDIQKPSPYTTNYEVHGSATFDIEYTTAGVRGRVLDAMTKRPLGSAAVVVRSTSAPDVFRGREAVTDDSGVFAFDAVPAGSYSITASLDAFGSDTKQITVGDSVQNLELLLAQSDGIQLKVVDGRTGRPLSANAAAFDAQGRPVQESMAPFVFPSNDNGTAVLSLPVAAGQYTVTVSAVNFAQVSIAVTAPSTRTVTMTPGGRIDIDSRHSEMRRVQLIDSTGNVYPRSSTLPRRYELVPRSLSPIEHIAPGSYTLQLLAPDDVTVVDSVRIEVLEGQTTKVEI